MVRAKKRPQILQGGDGALRGLVPLVSRGQQKPLNQLTSLLNAKNGVVWVLKEGIVHNGRGGGKS